MGTKNEATAKTYGGLSQKNLIAYVVGLGIMLISWFLPAVDPITPMGMKVIGTFLGVIILWATEVTLWPSLLGLLAIALTGYAGEGYAGIKTAFLNAYGNETVILIILATVLFGAMTESGTTQYISRWILTRKVINNRPYIFMAFVFLAGWALCALTSAVSSFILLWPICLRIMADIGVTKEDKVWHYFFVGMFITMTLGMCLFPFKGAVLGVIGTYNELSAEGVAYLPYMALNFIMTLLCMIVYLLIVKFIVRPDVSKLKEIDAERLQKEQPLPKMNIEQKLYLLMVPLYVLALILPSFMSKEIALIKMLSTIGTLGVTVIFIVFFCIARYQGRAMLDFKTVANKYVNWGLYFMIATAIYAAGALSSNDVGFKQFIIQLLNPILGNCPEFVFVFLVLFMAMLLTSFANNAASGIVLLPIVVSFCEQKGMDPTSLAMCVIMIVFMAMLTPAASPHASMMHGRKDIFEAKYIYKIGLPMSLLVLVLYTFVGYPLAKILF